jgi:hypothetical protein
MWNPLDVEVINNISPHKPQFNPIFFCLHILVVAEEVTNAIQTHKASLIKRFKLYNESLLNIYGFLSPVPPHIRR